MNDIRLIINRLPDQTRIGTTQADTLVDVTILPDRYPRLRGNVFAAQVTKVMPEIQAAFVTLGSGTEAFLKREDLMRREPFTSRHGPARVEDQIKQGQAVLVQVVTEPHQGKAAVVSQHIKLVGFSVVYVPNESFLRYSKKIADPQACFGKKLTPLTELPGAWIVRSFAQSAPAAQIIEEAKEIHAAFKKILDRFRASQKPRPLPTPQSHPMIDFIKQRAAPALTGITVDNDVLYAQIKAEMIRSAPQLLPKLRLFDSHIPIFEALGLENQIRRALSSRVYLKSGGYLEISEVPGMAVIDVNTGKIHSRKSRREVILATNREAAEEIGIQVRLRDLSGLIAVDFVDMPKAADRKAIDLAFATSLEDENRAIDLAPMNRFCVAMLTRQRLGAGLKERMSVRCPTCDGSGHLKSKDTLVIELYNHLQRDAPGMDGETIAVSCHPDLADHLRRQLKPAFRSLLEAHHLHLEIVADTHLAPDCFKIN